MTDSEYIEALRYGNGAWDVPRIDDDAAVIPAGDGCWVACYIHVLRDEVTEMKENDHDQAGNRGETSVSPARL